MDEYKAKSLEKIVKDNKIEDYAIGTLIGHGKSAAVFSSINENDNKKYALKIFDNDIVKRFGCEIQEQRIEQEIKLRNHNIPNLIKIYGGGQKEIESITYFYIVMEYIDGKNLKDFIQSEDYDERFILKVFKTLFETSEGLLSDYKLAHRDIKPENIIVEEGRITLLDLGVLKIIGKDSFTDTEEKEFVSTLRYSPPELLSREEKNSLPGWKAINVYQLGATLHDLIMKKEIFNNCSPYPKLVYAIRDDKPIIDNPEISNSLIQFVSNMLIKPWEKRLEMCNEKAIIQFLNDFDYIKQDRVRNDILELRRPYEKTFDEILNIRKSKTDKINKRKDVYLKIKNVIEECFDELLKENIYYKTITPSAHFAFPDDKMSRRQINGF
ncbi:MAG: protein kinase domain-containing protein [Candidatus Anammoxibacter sp.]